MEQAVTILAVDDKAENLMVLEEILKDMPFAIVKAGSGREALRHCLSQDFAVILLDVRMPEMSGFETAALIRDRGKSCHTPVIFITAAEESSEDVLKGYSMGAVDFVRKPVIPEILRAKVGVFVELFRKTQELMEAQEKEKELMKSAMLAEAERARADELERTLARFTVPSATAISAKSMGLGTLRDSLPDVFLQSVDNYAALIDLALETRTYKTDQSLSAPLREMSEKLGYSRAGPRDVVEIHSAALQRKAQEVPNPKKFQALSAEAKLMLLELMGYLVSYYRSLSFTAAGNSLNRRKHEYD
jgi:CheY-like chemotaxis protein